MKTSTLLASTGVLALPQRTLQPLLVLLPKTSRPFHTSRPLLVSNFKTRMKRLKRQLEKETNPGKIQKLEKRKELLSMEFQLKSDLPPHKTFGSALTSPGPAPGPSYAGLSGIERLDVQIARETDFHKRRQLGLRKVQLQVRQAARKPDPLAPGLEGLDRIEKLGVKIAEETNPDRVRVLEAKRERLLAEKAAKTSRERNISEVFASPSWSVKALLPSSTSSSSFFSSLFSPSTSSSPSSDEDPTITPETLHHLLRLSALPPPANATEQAAMLATLQTQLHFVRDIQTVDTTGIEPLHVIRDETVETVDKIVQARKGVLNKALAAETRVGFHARPRRVPGGATSSQSAPWQEDEEEEDEDEDEVNGQDEEQLTKRSGITTLSAKQYKKEEALVEMATRARRERGYFVVEGGKTKRGE